MMLALPLACASPSPSPRPSPAPVHLHAEPTANAPLDAGAARASSAPARLLTEDQVFEVIDNDQRIRGFATYRRALTVLTQRLGAPSAPERMRRVRKWLYGRHDGERCFGLVLVQSVGESAALGGHANISSLDCRAATLDSMKADAAKKLLATSLAPRFAEVSAAWETMLGAPMRDDESRLVGWRYLDRSGACKMYLVWDDKSVVDGWDETMDAPCE